MVKDTFDPGDYMIKETLYNVAKRYIEIVEAIERIHDKGRLMELEEARVIWHNKLIEKLKQEGISFRDRDHVTRIAYRIVYREL